MPHLDELFVRRTFDWLDLADGLLLLQYETAGAAPVAEYEGVTAFVQCGEQEGGPAQSKTETRVRWCRGVSISSITATARSA